MADIIRFALLTARRQEEITRLKWADLDRDKGIAWLDDVKHPRKKIGNRRAFRLLSEAREIIDRQPKVDIIQSRQCLELSKGLPARHFLSSSRALSPSCHSMLRIDLPS